jgi:hypothetical protein
MERSWGEKLVRQTYEGFMEDAELTSLLDGKDFWMESPEVIERLQKRKDLYENPPKKSTKRVKK